MITFFIYRNQVVKPALIGMTLLGLQEEYWNVPHHHRATTSLSVNYKLEKGEW